MDENGDEKVVVLELSELLAKSNVNLCSHPVVNHKMTQLRRSETSSKHFRELLREVTQYLGYMATQDLQTKALEVNTPVDTFSGCELATTVGIVPIMRSGLGMVEAMLDILPNAPVYHLGIYRDNKSLLPVVYYNKLPAEQAVQRAIVLEPLIATSGTINAAIEMLEDCGITDVHVIAAIGSRQGLSHLIKQHPNVKVHIAAIDDKLTERGYISPGLGDSGERLNNTGVPLGEEVVPEPKRQKLA